ncbi:MAG: succinate dehydrogenase assembly factor 2 [Parvularculales bacterium]
MTPEHRRARLHYRARRRGTREMDMILAHFADRYLAGFGEDELAMFEEILEIPERDLYDWLVHCHPVPESYCSPVMTLLLDMDSLPASLTSSASAFDEHSR